MNDYISNDYLLEIDHKIKKKLETLKVPEDIDEPALWIACWLSQLPEFKRYIGLLIKKIR